MVTGASMQEFNRARILSAPIVICPDLEDLEEETVPEERIGVPTLLGWVDVLDLVEALISRLLPVPCLVLCHVVSKPKCKSSVCTPETSKTSSGCLMFMSSSLPEAKAVLACRPGKQAA